MYPHICHQFSAAANVTYPEAYERFLSIVDLQNLDLISFLAAGCMISTDFFDRLLISTSMPVAVLAVLAGTYAAAMMCGGTGAAMAMGFRKQE